MKNNLLLEIVHRLGIDKSIAYSSGSRVVQGLTGVASVFFIATFLSGEEQGFYYTFGSILGLQVFFELGLTGIMTQYVAHEASHLKLNDDLHYAGDNRYISRLASLIRFCVKWYSVLAVLVFIFLWIVGILFFTRYGDGHVGISWRAPWLLICIGTGIKLFQSPFSSILMGLGKVKEMSKIGFYQQLILPATVWLGLACNFKLYVVGISYLMSVLIWQLYVWKTKLAMIIVNLYKVHVSETVSYLKEIFPYQWRIALSWVSGYFIYQLFNPVLFATEGAVVAGQMGMTLTALNAINVFAVSWLNTKVPLYSQLIALKDYNYLDQIFSKTLKQMAFVCALLLSVFFLFTIMLNLTQIKIGSSVLADRFLSYIPLLFMMIPVFLGQFTTSWATYLRCHKKEPFLLNSICGGIASCFCMFVFGHLYGLYGVTISYTCIAVAFFPWGYWIYRTKKAEWHGK